MDVPADRTVQALRRAFETWGLPGRIRVDNGQPWVAPTGDLPTALGLWLWGLGVDLVPNRVGRPEDNGAVEGSQRTGQRWADPPRCGSAAELQRQLDAMDRHQREGFPDAAHSRLRLFPGLAHSGRAFHRAGEAARWQLGRVREKLAEYAVVRQVNARGLVSIYGRNYAVARRYAGESVYVRLDAESGDWLIERADCPLIGRYPAELSREAILGRRVTGRHHGRARGADGGRQSGPGAAPPRANR
jgi:hypothetical protein